MIFVTASSPGAMLSVRSANLCAIIRRQLLLAGASAAVFAPALLPAFAQQVWTGDAGTTDWNTGANWQSAQVPTSSEVGQIGVAPTAPTVFPIIDVGQDIAMFNVTVGLDREGELTIRNGGALTTGGSIVGAIAGSNGIVRVIGAGSAWNYLANAGLVIGDGGIGTLLIEDGGAVSHQTVAPLSANGTIGLRSGSIGSTVVTGAGSSWSGLNLLVVGGGGTGSLTVMNGGSVANGFVTMADQSASSGSALVSGAGSIWAVSGSLSIGLRGSADLVVANGGEITSAGASLGASAGSSGTAHVSGIGTTWNNAGSLIVGSGGTGALTVENGGVATSSDIAVGSASTAAGAVLVTGSGSALTSSGGMSIGDSGAGSLTIADGGSVTALGGVVGGDLSGTVLVTDAGSTWNVNDILLVGSGAGTGTITIANGGLVTSAFSLIGSGATGTVSVANGGSAWNAGDLLIIGESGRGSLLVEDSGSVSSAFSVIGVGDGANGTVRVTDAGSNWNAGDVLSIGSFEGSGTLTIANGGTVTSSASIIGEGAGSSGSVLVTDQGSIWNAGNALSIGGGSGAGVVSMAVSNGGGVASASSIVGDAVASNATVLITGQSSNWTTGDLTVGAFGTGALTVTNGGTVGSETSQIGSNGVGAIGVVGIGSVWANTGPMTVGGAGQGTLTISMGASVSAPDLFIARDPGSRGEVNIGAPSGFAPIEPGMLETATIAFGDGSGVLTLNHTDAKYVFAAGISGSGNINLLSGSTALTGDSSQFSGQTSLSGGTLQIGDGGAAGALGGDIVDDTAVTFNRSDILIHRGVISGTGTLTQAGSGAVLFTADHTYLGGTMITAGTLQLGDGGTSGSVMGDVANDGVLAFNRSDVVTFSGLISGSGSVQQHGTGTTVLTADHTYGGGTTITAGTLQLGDGGTSGSVVGDVANDGALVFNRSDAVTFNSLISGSGSVQQRGTGTTVLTADHTYGGGTTIAVGTLRIDGSIASSTYVETDGVLAGTGTIFGSVTNRGTVSPGASIGTLRVVGGYVGAGGALAIEAVLADDAAPADRLMIDGGTSSGATTMLVTQVDGLGALTPGDGIQVVQTVNGGTTEPDAFTLGNPGGYVAAGPYAYTLARSSRDGISDPQGWYLRSTLDCTLDPGADVCEQIPEAPNIRPEVSVVAAIPAMALGYGYRLMDRLHERVGAVPGFAPGSTHLGWGRVLAVNGTQDSDSLGVLGREGPEYDWRLYGVQAGLDVWGRDGVNGSATDRAGLYVAFGEASSEVEHFTGLEAGEVTLDGQTLGAYWTHFGVSNWYVDAVLQATWYDVNSRSTASPGLGLKTDGFGWGASLESGYPFRIADHWIMEPQAQLVYQSVSLDTADEYGNPTPHATVVRFLNVESLIGRLGVRFAYDWAFEPTASPSSLWVRTSVMEEFLAEPEIAFSSESGFVPFATDLHDTAARVDVGFDLVLARYVSLFGHAGFTSGLDGNSRAWDAKLGFKVDY